MGATRVRGHEDAEPHSESRVRVRPVVAGEYARVARPGDGQLRALTILHEVGLHRQRDGTIDTSAFKIVYVAPMKALVSEIVGNLSNRLKSFGINVRELTRACG